MNLKKLRAITTVLILGCGIIVGDAFAHPPTEINLEYNNEDKVLNIEIDHVSHNVTDHFIRLVVVSLNDEVVVRERFAKQSTPPQEVLTVPLEVQRGDVIHVKAICSKAGYKEASLTVSQ